MRVDPADIQAYLHEHIPMSLAMQASVLQADWDTVVLRAPLAPNINHRETVFGGSASTLAILSAWSLLHVRLKILGTTGNLVIQRNSMDYLQPMSDAFQASAEIENNSGWDKFLMILKRRNRSRISISAVLKCAGEISGRFRGDFVAIGASGGLRPQKN